MNRHVVDSSVVLIVLKSELGFESILPLLPRALISAVNVAECITVLVRDGTPPNDARESLASTQVIVAPFDRDLAEQTGALIAQTRHAGLSLGDRACLALGAREKLPVFTADRSWKGVNVGVEIQLVR